MGQGCCRNFCKQMDKCCSCLCGYLVCCTKCCRCIFKRPFLAMLLISTFLHLIPGIYLLIQVIPLQGGSCDMSKPDNRINSNGYDFLTHALILGVNMITLFTFMLYLFCKFKKAGDINDKSNEMIRRENNALERTVNLVVYNKIILVYLFLTLLAYLWNGKIVKIAYGHGGVDVVNAVEPDNGCEKPQYKEFCDAPTDCWKEHEMLF